ncbi:MULTISPECIES: cation:proton antiporter [unclassified Pseudoclavibacter]|uniref:cation:proton antiporter n=1 Tax=unclassified Pseudoclavibacter TaxID=2615177 RepID=UPI0015C96021|nr:MULTISPECIES: sodium:proton antiporter [unclassified Pseudoclavibacter]MBS3178145.1 sodium:proton antiporter [Pseudoclavibacter sp. Marseille-Q4354]NYF13847.1 CPA1 family monovalent cation:H+ antiporter [Pseudoclavibacter sp. JAI123]
MELELAVFGVAAILIIVAVAAVAPKLGVAAPILLVIVGIGVGYLPGVPDFEFPPEIILTIVLPPILYSAAVNVPLTDFRRNLRSITGLSVLLVIISAFGSGLLLFALLPDLNFAAAVALGAVISPPDAVAATSIGKRLGLPPRLVTVLEGEGLVNDATALVMLRSAIAATAGALSFWGAVGDFVLAVTLAVVLGALVGAVTVFVRSRLGSPVLTTAISFTVPFLAYVPTEEIGGSGVLAVVVAGLVTGHASASRFSPQDRISERTNWRTAQLLLENGVFLLMGFELSALIESVDGDEDGIGLLHAVGIGLLATAALVLIRVAFVIPLVLMLRSEQRRATLVAPRLDQFLERVAGKDNVRPRLLDRAKRASADMAFYRDEGLGWRGGAVLAWSGMRGVVTLAAAQSLPSDFPYRPQLVLIAFTVAIVTLVVQGGSLPWLIKRLGVTGTDAQADARELSSLADEVFDVAQESLANPELRRADGQSYDPEVLEQVRTLAARMGGLLANRAELDEDLDDAHLQRRELTRILLDNAQLALLDARSSGTYSSRTIEQAQNRLDTEALRFGGA